MQPNNEILIDYLDSRLSPEETAAFEAMVQKDTRLAVELEYLKLALSTVRLNAIHEKVSAIRQSLETNRAVEKQSPAIVRRMSTVSMRVAAIAVLIIGITVLYKYISVNDQAVYNKQFMGYELNNTRGPIPKDAESEAYQNKKWNEVTALYHAQNVNSNKSVFLAAMAEMQLHHFPQAVALFENILNSGTGDHSFREESEYYVALAYLMNHEEDKSINMLNKIKSDPRHTYYPLASRISTIDLKIIALKK
jgi:tetratricopeptide (TPR) repeat protein